MLQQLRIYWTEIPVWLRNPYTISLALFIVWMLFFDDNNMMMQWERQSEINALADKISFYDKGIRESKEELRELTTNPASQEKFAREHYYMKRDNEDRYRHRSLIGQRPRSNYHGIDRKRNLEHG